jgi:mannose-6-phosphate isomerase-like protein (cupin superfamily)
MHIHPDDVDDESWDSRSGSRITWRTLLGRDGSAPAGLTSGVADLPPGGGRLELHRHDPPEVYHVLAGTGVVTVGADHHDVRPGSTVLIPSSTWHAIHNTGAEVLRLFYCFPVDHFGDVVYEYADELDP